ncbi:MAG: hypothetical protein GON13_02310 [Nanoarchaeota archaeon]|nr:hypothetical protein [Nanoarchaeota archaeon]
MEGLTLLARFAFGAANNEDCICPFKSKKIIELEQEIKTNIKLEEGNLYENIRKISRENPLSLETVEAYVIGNKISLSNHKLHHNYAVLKILEKLPNLNNNESFKEKTRNCLITPGIYNGKSINTFSSKIVKNPFELQLERGDMVLIHYNSALTKINEKQYETLKEITEKIIGNIPNNEWIKQQFPTLEKLQPIQDA